LQRGIARGSQQVHIIELIGAAVDPQDFRRAEVAAELGGIDLPELIRGEEEQLVLANRTAQGDAGEEALVERLGRGAVEKFRASVF